MIHHPFKIVEMFEEEVANFAGSKFAVAVDSCTNALLLCCQYFQVDKVTIPAKTYLSVPQSIMNAGGEVQFEELDWKGIYQLKPYPIYDSAKRLRKEMYIPDSMMCLSFHHKKPLKIGKGGMILLDDEDAAQWLRKMRYEGRTELMDYRKDNIQLCGRNVYMTPEQAARGLTLIQHHPANFPDQEESPGYSDLRNFDLFRNCKTV